MALIGEVGRDHHDAGSGNVSSFAIDVDIDVPVGSRVLVAVNAPAVAVMSGYTATDSQGNTYTARGFSAHSVPANGQVGILGADITTALDNTDTITVTSIDRSPGKWSIIALAYDDLDDGYDTTAGAGTNSTTSGTVTSGSTSSAAQNQELVFGAVGFTDAGAATTYTATDGFTTAVAKETADPSSAPKALVVVWGYVDAAGSRSFSGNLSTSQAWAAVVGSWKQTFTSPPTGDTVWNWIDNSGDPQPLDFIPL